MARAAGPAGDRYHPLHQRNSAGTAPSRDRPAGMPGRLDDFEVARKLNHTCGTKRQCRYPNKGDRWKWGSFLMTLMSRGSAFGLPLLILVALLLGTASPAVGAEKFCSDPPYFGVIDGNIRPVPIQITIDRDCTFKNFPQSNPLTTTINFQTNDPSIYLIIFDDVIFTGHMACANVDHRIWFSNSSYYGSNNACQDLFIPVFSYP
jgi:hypothetical protein